MPASVCRAMSAGIPYSSWNASRQDSAPAPPLWIKVPSMSKSSASRSCGASATVLLGVAPELLPHRGQQAIRELVFATRGEPLVERRGDHVRGHALLDRRKHGPAAFARVGHATLEPLQ